MMENMCKMVIKKKKRYKFVKTSEVCFMERKEEAESSIAGK